MSHLAHFSFFSLGVFSFWGLFFLAASTLLAAPHGSRHKLIESRTVTFHYQATIPPVKSGEGPVDFFIPIAQSDEFQDVLERTINSPVKGSLRKEEKYGNLYWHAHLKDTGGKPVPITIIYKIERKLHQQPELKTVADLSLSRKTLNRHALFLQPNERVPIDGPIIQKVRADLPKVKKNTPYYKARSIYDYVIDTMEYKKIGTGWGNGDTYWACSERYGNCTDFHALFISLARAEKLPSRFEIGFPIPEGVTEGEVKGYHCWVNFYLPKVGWTPIDASEAAKNPEKRELFFGTHPADRIKFSVGRDIELGQGHNTAPLNYFIYPHLEVGGKRVKDVQTHFFFKS